jgi:uncharacterized RDD family membrane protein YckC
MSLSASPANLVTYQAHYAGAVSRFAAYAIDITVATGLFSLALAGISYVVQILTGHQVHWSRSNIVVAIIYFMWLGIYFAYSWAVSGRTFGMAVLGVRVVSADGTDLPPSRAVVRTLAFPLSFLLFGLRFLARQAELTADTNLPPAATAPEITP